MPSDAKFDWRPIAEQDAGAWADLLAAIEAADHAEEHYSEQDLRADFSNPQLDFGRGSLAAWDGSVMVAFMVLATGTVADPVHQVHLRGDVHPACRRRGLGTRLLSWAQEAAIRLHEGLFPGRPLTLMGSCLRRLDDATALFAASGFEAARWFHDMTLGLSALPAEAPPPDGIQITGFTMERLLDALLVRNEAFRDHWGSTETSLENWTHSINHHVFRAAFSFLAYAGPEPTGLVLANEWEADTAATGRRDLNIPTVGTRRAGRGRGVASALLLRTLTQARDAGFDTASLGVDADSPTGALGLYQRLGFTVRDTSVAYRKPVLQPVG